MVTKLSFQGTLLVFISITKKQMSWLFLEIEGCLYVDYLKGGWLVV